MSQLDSHEKLLQCGFTERTKLSQRIPVRSFHLAKNFLIKDGRCPPQVMFDANHFHIEATFDTTDSDKMSKQS